MDPEACRRVVDGAAAVYHCMNPRYDTRVWEAELPRIQENLVAAAGKAGARLVVLDNLYAVGRTGGRAMDETTPASPCSRKGAIRARLAASLQEAVRRGDVRAVTGRASDFFGPGGVMTAFGERFWTRLFAGKGAEVLGNPETPHTYHFIPDVAAGLAALGEAGDEASGAAEGTGGSCPALRPGARASSWPGSRPSAGIPARCGGCLAPW